MAEYNGGRTGYVSGGIRYGLRIIFLWLKIREL